MTLVALYKRKSVCLLTTVIFKFLFYEFREVSNSIQNLVASFRGTYPFITNARPLVSSRILDFSKITLKAYFVPSSLNVDAVILISWLEVYTAWYHFESCVSCIHIR